MLARALRLILLGELGVYAALGAVLVLSQDWTWRDAMLLGAILWLWLRASLVALTFVLSRAWGTASLPPPLGILGRVRLMLEEYLAFIALFSLIQPFEHWFMGPDRLRRLRPEERPVLLVHGYVCNRGVYWWLRRRLEEAGYCVATVTLEPVLGGVERCVESLRRRIEEVCTTTGAKQLVLVAHSMGGLVARAYLRDHGAARLARVITVATPNQGSRLARLGIGKNALDMLPGSAWLAALNADPVTAIGVTAMGSAYDTFVIPHPNQMLPKGDDRSLPPVGHLAQAFSEHALRELVRVVEEVGNEASGSRHSNEQARVVTTGHYGAPEG
jgi:triacylglycerol lipase